ncbi:MAG: gamma-glutamylcyclotransferase, partial [Bacteroidota bacterium]
MNKLFVYGTLGPGRPNEHILSSIGGSWQAGSVKGNLYEEGWGAVMGFPGIVLDEAG